MSEGETIYYGTTSSDEVENMLSQTPSEALGSPKFIATYVINIISCFLINVFFAFLFLNSYDRIGLKTAPSFVFENDVKYLYSGTSAIVDMTIAVFLVIFFSYWIGDCSIRGEVEKGQNMPVPTRSLNSYRIFGVTITNVIPRMAVACLWVMPIVIGFVYGMMALSCKSGTMPFYDDGDIKECYMTTKSYYWFKGLYCALCTLLFQPFLYLSALNRENITEIEHLGFLESRQNLPPVANTANRDISTTNYA